MSHQVSQRVTHLLIAVVGAGALLVGAGVGGRTRSAAAGKVEDALELAVVEEEVERPHVAHLACAAPERKATSAL